jgi:hypothetical protein
MQLLKTEKTHCPVCARPVKDYHTTMTVHGLTFHAYCASYKRRVAG